MLVAKSTPQKPHEADLAVMKKNCAQVLRELVEEEQDPYGLSKPALKEPDVDDEDDSFVSCHYGPFGHISELSPAVDLREGSSNGVGQIGFVADFYCPTLAARHKLGVSQLCVLLSQVKKARLPTARKRKLVSESDDIVRALDGNAVLFF